jgi:hypothetical protein
MHHKQHHETEQANMIARLLVLALLQGHAEEY